MHLLQRGKPLLKGLIYEAGNKQGNENTQKRGSFPPWDKMLLAESHSVVLVFADNTANITVKYGQFNREHTKFHYLPVLISDNGVPSLTGTSTLTVGVCKCNEQGEFTFCEEMAAQAVVSIQALVAIFLCILTITGQCPMGQGGDIKRASQKRQGSGQILHHSRAHNACVAYRDIDVEPEGGTGKKG